MASEDEKKGAHAPTDEGSPPGDTAGAPSPAADHHDDEAHGYESDVAIESGGQVESPPEPSTALTKPPAAPPPPPPPPSPPEEEEEGMLRMSFLEHLEELRSRILRALAGVGVAFAFSLIFANQLWLVVSEPAIFALTTLGYKEPRLAQITPMETFTTVWVKLPLLTAVFLASPWILYQVWAFIAPGLYRKERRWAAPFVLCSAGLFILGGLFAYFVAFRFGLTFLLGIGRDIRIQPLVSVSEYFDLFVNVTLGVGLVFEMPVLIFFLTLLRIVTPSFLIRNSRYAILIITIIAAIVTPTPDVVNLMMFAIPMCLLYFVGVFAGYLLVLHREQRRFPWGKLFAIIGTILLVSAGIVYLMIAKYGYKFVHHWPYLRR